MSDAVRFEAVTVAPQESEGWTEPLTLVVPTGSFYLLVAPASPAGRVVRLCTGTLVPVRGRVEVLGEEPVRLGRFVLQRFRRSLGVALQPGGLVSNLTLRMNVVLSLVHSGILRREEADRRATEVLDEVGVQRWADLRPADVPPDVRQRVVLARAIARTPRLLLLEDPLTALRPDQEAPMLSLLRQRADTVFMTTYRRVPAVERYVDRVVSWDTHHTDLQTDEVGTL